MALTQAQARTFERLIDPGDGVEFDSGLPGRLGSHIEQSVGELPAGGLWLGKSKLSDADRCEGMFISSVRGEAGEFAHSVNTAAGVLLHKAIEIEISSRDHLEPAVVAEVAVERLRSKEVRFDEYWESLPAVQQDELLMEANRRVTLFRASFPPLKDMRAMLTPVTELSARAELAGKNLVLSGRMDLVLGSTDKARPHLAKRAVIDLKTGNAYPEHAQDLRFYALLMTLRFGVPPFRVASYFLESGTWQPEEITEEILFLAADRVISAARSATEMLLGREPKLSPGRYCEWCFRSPDCPVAELPGS